jgi:bacteriocin-like protein
VTENNNANEKENKLAAEAEVNNAPVNAIADQELNDTDLNSVSGGLLLPAVQAAREAASRIKSG